MAAASVQIDLKAADGGLKQLLESKRVSDPAIAYVTGTVAPQLGIDCLQDFVSWFSMANYEDEIKNLGFEDSGEDVNVGCFTEKQKFRMNPVSEFETEDLKDFIEGLRTGKVQLSP